MLSLATNFELHINGMELSCARISAVELVADASQIERRGDAQADVQCDAPRMTGRLIIARALDGDRTLYHWRREAMGGKPAMRLVEIHHLDRPDGETIHVWQMRDAWPLRWTGPRYDALHGGIAFEELELIYDDVLWLETSRPRK